MKKPALEKEHSCIDSTPSHLGRSDAATAGHQALVDELVNDVFKKMSEGKATWNQWVFVFGIRANIEDIED